MSRVSKLASLPVSLPQTSLPKDVNPSEIAAQHSDILSLIQHPTSFLEDASWRDTFALTGTLRTFYSPEGIVEAWRATTGKVSKPDPASFKVLPDAAQKIELPNGTAWIEVTFLFETDLSNGLRGECTGMLSLVPPALDDKGGKWKIWVMRTILEQFKGYPDVDVGVLRQAAVKGSGISTNGEHTGETAHYDTVIVGGGQSGLSVAGRLQALNMSYVLIDRNKYIGDSWNVRYDSVKIHTGRNFAHLPFDRTFPDTYQEMLQKHELAKGYQDWAKKFGVEDHVWLETVLESGTWDENEKLWELKVKRKGREQAIGCKFVIMAIGGGSQIPKAPEYPGQETFKGTAIHSAQYTSPKAFKGKHGVVVGTANTAHDVAEDMLNAGLASVTMLQRSPTYIIPYQHWRNVETQTYNETFPTVLADKLLHTGSAAVSRLIVLMAVHAMATNEIELFNGLSKAGFMTDVYGDLFWHLFERAGGHYMDVGNCANIINGSVKMKSDAAITHFTPDGIAFSDGSELPADFVVFATGFQVNMRDEIRRLFGDDVASRVDDFWSPDEEGELRGIWKLQHPGLICHGATMAQSRYYSRYIALQIEAALEGRPLEQYLETPVPPKQLPVNGH